MLLSSGYINTPIESPLLNTNANNLKPNVVTTRLKPEAAIKAKYQYLSTVDAMVIMNPCQVEALMRSTTTMSYKEQSLKANTLIDVAASFNFVSKRTHMANGFYKECKTSPKLSIRVANEHRTSTT